MCIDTNTHIYVYCTRMLVAILLYFVNNNNTVYDIWFCFYFLLVSMILNVRNFKNHIARLNFLQKAKYQCVNMNQLPMHDALKPLAWLEGIWRTENVAAGQFPTINPFEYCEEITFSSIGQPALNYTAQSWHSQKKNPMHREVGILKIIPNTNQLSLFLAHNFGLTTIEEGEVVDKAITLQSTSISRHVKKSKPPAVLQIKREFKLINDELHQTVYMATETTPELTLHLTATYKKQKDSVCK